MLFALLVVVVAAIYIFVKKQYSYWERNGIPSHKPNIPFGNLQSLVEKKRSFGHAIYDLYTNTTEPFIGIYFFFRPALLVRDAALVKNVLLNDFQNFHDRGVYCEPGTDPMSATLFALPGRKWKSLRAKLTPAFTSGKLKGMFSTISNIASELVKVCEPIAENHEEIEIRQISGLYVADCIAAIAFGLDNVSTLSDPNHEFLLKGKDVSKISGFLSLIRRSAIFLCPNLLKFLGMKGLPPYIEEYCLNMVTQTIKNRETTGEVRKDIMQYLIQLRNNGSLENGNGKVDDTDKQAMSFEQIAGQVFMFYMAGNETSTSTIAYTLYELSQDVDLMRRAQEDIEQTLEKYNGQLTYEAISDMQFVDLCVKETLRKYPFPMLNRECTKDYQIPGTQMVIKKGTPIVVSVLGIHRDEQYFPEPNRYNPDRFKSEEYAFNEDMYMPFGAGPRNCIAYRMGLLVSKVAVVMVLRHYKIEMVKREELEFDYRGVGFVPKPGQCKVRLVKKVVVE
ncbi:hypothetical protein HA402_007136 [Bradysia odoriphaga]|nr:hypothetical protein HA402_007136 [Bradysia odoriphaga]